MAIKQDLTDYRDLYAGHAIGFDQPNGALSCTARIATSIDKNRLSVKPRIATH